MKEVSISEDNQWIPWEISYSLKEHIRNERRSITNSILAVVIPDERNSYDYYITDYKCGNCTCRMLKTPSLIKIMQGNMFNIKKPSFVNCLSKTVYKGLFSYIPSVKWCDFIDDAKKYFDIAVEINENFNDYNITKNCIIKRRIVGDEEYDQASRDDSIYNK